MNIENQRRKEFLALPELSLAEAIEQKPKLLVEGIAVDDSLRERQDQYKPVIMAIYGHEKGPQQSFRVPEEISLWRSDQDPRDSILVRMRQNGDSANVLSMKDNQTVLKSGDNTYRVELEPKPFFYDKQTTSGTEVWKIVQRLGTDMLAVTSNNFCSYFSTHDECAFCELVPSYQGAREYKKSTKPSSEIREALNIAIASDEARTMVVTCGNYDNDNIRSMVELYDALSGVDVSGMDQVCTVSFPPVDLGLVEQLKEVGYTDVVFNMEVYREEQAPLVTPGKYKYYGRERLMKSLQFLAGNRSFGPGRVYTTFVYGIQSLDGLDPTSFNADRENEILLEATDAMLDIGVIPLFTVYHSIGANKIGRIELDSDRLHKFGLEYGKRVYESRVVPDPHRSGSYNGVGSIANHLFNDYYFLAKQT